MNRRDNRGDWTVVAAIGLIALGVWFLLGNIFGTMWQEAISHAFEIAWPIALIGLGLLLLVSSRSSTAAGGSGRRLYRSRDDRMIGGVLAGVADYFGTDPTVVRVIYAIFGVLTGVWPAIVLYVIALIVVPEAPAAGSPMAPEWPQPQAPPVTPAPPDSAGWPHAGTETVQTPAPAPPPAPVAEQDSAGQAEPEQR